MSKSNGLIYFEDDEFACRCGCGSGKMDADFLARLDVARCMAKTPFVINSGIRCIKHNKDVGGENHSAHLRGLAADIAVQDHNRFAILRAVLDAGFDRIGLGLALIHVDMDMSLPHPACWPYKDK
jgi:hypothetical protein